jgi:hypothetical protein
MGPRQEPRAAWIGSGFLSRRGREAAGSGGRVPQAQGMTGKARPWGNSSGARRGCLSRFPWHGAPLWVSLARNCLVIFFTVTLHSGCTESFEVLTTLDGGTPWKDCVRALKEGHSGEPCEDFEGCVTRTPDGCCSRVAECKAGVLEIQEACQPDCPARCVDDSSCLSGREWCTSGVCTACQPPPSGCFDKCPRGWIPTTRNGCYTCECVPPSQCHQDADCGPGLSCYGGVACPSGCRPGDPSCCEGNFCSPPGCLRQPPTGCMTVGCAAGSTCVTRGCTPSACRCDSATGTWLCATDCEGGVCVTVR